MTMLRDQCCIHRVSLDLKMCWTGISATIRKRALGSMSEISLLSAHLGVTADCIATALMVFQMKEGSGRTGCCVSSIAAKEPQAR